jgi:aminoglycoside phosphotransferase
MTPHGWIAELGPDLWSLVQDRDAPLIAATRINRLPSVHTGRASFRLVFAGHRILKGRQAATPVEATRIRTLLRLLPPEHFPRLVAQRGRALLIEWMSGVALRRRDCSLALLRQCGQLHAAIHRLPVPPRGRVPLSRRPVDWEARFEAQLQQLVSGGALGSDEARTAVRLAQRHAPERTRLAMCHGDFCAENIVRDRVGRLYVVDNETVAVDACEYDLARTWYRWPMTDRQRGAYLEGYGQGPPLWSFVNHILHLALVVLAESAAYRLRVHAPSAHAPIRRLRAVLSRPIVTELLPPPPSTGRPARLRPDW